VQDRIVAKQSHRQLEQFREDLASGFYETVIQQALEIVATNETKPPADVAFYALGEAYAHQDYAGRNYDVSRYYFEKLIELFPESTLTAEAKTYISFFEKIAAGGKKAAAPMPPSPPKKTPAVTSPQATPTPLPRKVVENHNFEKAVQKNLLILEQSGRQHPADEALYNLGLIYAHIDNPAKDFKKSRLYFHALVKQFPDSALAEEARIWLGLFETIDKMQQIDIEIEQQKKQLTR
jgi:tetratricopeptide (TPR) repeat protein